MKTLTRYIGREVLSAILLIFSALVILFAFFDLIHELGDVGRGGYTISSALLFVGLQLPSRMYELFPVAIADRHAVRAGAARLELGVHRDARRRAHRCCRWAGRWCASASRCRSSPFLPANSSRRRPPCSRSSVRAQALGDTTRVVAQQFRSGFWFKQDQTFVNIRSVLADLTLVGISIYEFDDDFRLRNVRTADAGSFAGNGQWHLKAVRNTEIALTGTKTTQADSFTWNSVLRPSLLTVYQVAPEKLELNTLWENMRLLGSGTQKTTRFEIAFWNKVFYPAAVLVMMIVALPFSYFQRRQGGVGFRIFAGTMLGLSFFLTGRLFSNLGVLNDWPALFSAAFPLVVFIAMTVSMLWWLERR